MGFLVLVSHDRAFMDNVVTSTIAWEGPGQWREYEGGVSDWQTQSERARQWASGERAPLADAPAKPPAPAATSNIDQNALNPATDKREQLSKKKLSYKEQRELDSLPARIEALESEQNEIRATLADGQLYQSDLARAVALQARDGEIETALHEALERWSALEAGGGAAA